MTQPPRLGMEERYRLLAETMLQGVVHHDAAGQIIEMNPAAERILGRSREELIGSDSVQEEEHTIRENGSRFPGADHPCMVALRTGERQLGVVMGVFNPRERKYRWIRIDAVPVFQPGRAAPCEAYSIFQDITESRRSEEALRESQERLRLATEAAGLGVWQWQPSEDRAIWENDRQYEIFGVPRSEGPLSAAKFISDFLDPDDRPAFELAISNTVSSGAPFSFRGRFRRGDGEIRWLEFTGIPSGHDEGDARRVLGTVRDITESRRAEEALRQSASLFATLVDQAPTGTYVVDSQLRFHRVNVLALPFFAHVDSLIGRHLDEVMEIMWGPELGARCGAIFRNILETGERYISPSFSEQRRDLGVEQAFEWEAQRVVLPDGTYGVACYFRDVTEKVITERALRVSEERRRLATEATGVGIWEWNIATDQILWDSQMFQIYGIPPTADGIVPYHLWSTAVLPEDLPLQEALLKETVRKCGHGNREFRIRRREDGEIRHLQSVEIVRTDDMGNPAFVVGTNLDITARKLAETALGGVAKRKDEFIAMLSHELRNPLTAIRHAVQIASDSPQDTAACRWAGEVVDRQSLQLSRMVDDLLDVARITRGRIELRRVDVDLRTVIGQAVAAASPWMEQRRHTFAIDLEHGPLWVNGDAARLEQVFVNLLSNAAKYTHVGGTIRLAARRGATETLISITDNGSGIAADLLPHVFDLFTQGSTSLDRAQGGLGIGLTVVKSLIGMHGGSIVAESAGADTGAVFTVRLPLIPAPPEAPMKRARPGEVTGTPKPLTLPAGMRVLIVEDHIDAAKTLERLLTRRNAEVRIAHDGPQGIITALEFRPKVLLLDIGLPGYNGYELARSLRAREELAGSLFVAVSGYAGEADRAKSLEAGFDFHLAKPVDFGALIAVIRKRFAE